MATVFTFGGGTTRVPSVRAIVKDAGLFPAGVGRLQTVALIGEGKGLEPGVPILFGSPSGALEAIRGGNLAQAIPHVFSPSAESAGASLVMVVRVNPAIPATLTLQDSAPADAIELTSRNWGIEDNLIKVTVAAGTVAGSKKLTVSKGTPFYSQDNILRNCFSIEYTGAGTAATMTITGTTLATTVTAGAPGENLAITLSSYGTIQELVDFINANDGYTAITLADNPGGPLLNSLDFVTAVDIQAAPVVVTAVLQAMLDWFNGSGQPLVKAVRATGAGLPPANIGPVYLSGGAEGSTQASDWTAALAALENLDIAYVVPLSSDAAVHAQVLTHINFSSANGKQPRVAFLGAALGEKDATLSAYQTRIQAINSDRVGFISQGVKDFVDGVLTTLPPYYLAAQIAGLQAGLPEIGDPLTTKSLQIQGLEWVPTRGELERMIELGILAVEQVANRGFFRITRGISTWLKSDAAHRVELSARVALDEVVRRVINDQEPLLGTKASPLTVGRSVSVAGSTLRTLENDGIIVGNAASPAYKNITASLSGDRIDLTFEASPVLPLNFIAVTIHATAFSDEISITLA